MRTTSLNAANVVKDQLETNIVAIHSLKNKVFEMCRSTKDRHILNNKLWEVHDLLVDVIDKIDQANDILEDL